MHSEDDSSEFLFRADTTGAILRLDTGGCCHCKDDDSFERVNFYVSPLPPIFMVADGIRVSEEGKWASHLAVKKVATLLQLARHQGRWEPHPKWHLESLEGDTGELEGVLRYVMRRAHEQLRKIIDFSKQTALVNSAFTVALIQGRQLVFAHLGDTRLYHLRGFQLRCLTEDHTLAMTLLKESAITHDQYDGHEDRLVLTKFLGGDECHDPMVGRFALEPGDQILLCSRGVYGTLSEEIIRGILNGSSLSTNDAAKRLIRLSNGKSEGNNPVAVIGRTN